MPSPSWRRAGPIGRIERPTSSVSSDRWFRRRGANRPPSRRGVEERSVAGAAHARTEVRRKPSIIGRGSMVRSRRFVNPNRRVDGPDAPRAIHPPLLPTRSDPESPLDRRETRAIRPTAGTPERSSTPKIHVDPRKMRRDFPCSFLFCNVLQSSFPHDYGEDGATNKTWGTRLARPNMPNLARDSEK